MKIKGFLKKIMKHKYVTTLVVFLALIGYLDSNSLYDRYKLYLEERDLQSQVDACKEQYNRDTKLYMELMDDPDAVVRIAREKYYMKNENEDVYVFGDAYSSDETVK
ncbi:MAG: septum formation initiator family protein [Bacteroidaceae bacterium]